jgi:DNA-binding transcriptional regulator/RsmH inhibitor MraZ
VVPADTFEEVAREMLEQVKRGEVSRAEMRATAASANELTVDAQGRINLDERAREYAGLTLGSRVVVAGAFDRVEIWELTRYQTINTAGNAEIAGVEA